MEVQIQNLVDKIKKDGIASAEEQAAAIIGEAEKRAKAIVETAQADAAALLKKAETESERFAQASEAAVKQACRNALIAFQEGLVKALDSFIKTETNKAYTADVLKSLIPETVKGWLKEHTDDDLAVILSPANAKELEGALSGAFKKEIEKGIEIKSDTQLSGGFRIGIKDGSAYYDFSAEAVADLFSNYVSSRAARLLKDAAKEL